MGAAKDKEIDTNLHWETNEQTNLGIDMGFMDNALNVTLDYFIRNSYDLLLDRNMRPSTGLLPFIRMPVKSKIKDLNLL